MSEKMRRYNLSLQRPQEKLRQRAIESEGMRKEREPEERCKKWKKWLGLADFTEYEGPFPFLLYAFFFLVIFLGGISLCVLGLFKYPYKIQVMNVLYGIFFTIWGAKALMALYPVIKAAMLYFFKDKKK